MNDKYKNKYRISSARLASWDYGWQALYFVTICTARREHFFGEIVDHSMVLSDLGRIVEAEWIGTPAIRPDMNLELDAWCMMPNHFHAIIAIGGNIYNIGADQHTDLLDGISAPHHRSIAKFGPQSKNLASILRGFKSSVTTQSRLIGIRFGWQPRYHDHIIRDKNEFHRIQTYIVNNPLNWITDPL